MITTEGIKNEALAISRNKSVSIRVREVIRESGSQLPEDLPTETPIKEIEKRVSDRKRKQIRGPGQS